MKDDQEASGQNPQDRNGLGNGPGAGEGLMIPAELPTANGI